MSDSSTNIFEFATRSKLRFASAKGELTAENLWDVPLRSSNDFNLDAIAKSASKALKDATEESFVSTATRTPAHKRLEVTLETVKHVIATKLAEEAAARKNAERRSEKEKLLRILAEKQEGELSALSKKDLQDRIAELGEV